VPSRRGELIRPNSSLVGSLVSRELTIAMPFSLEKSSSMCVKRCGEASFDVRVAAPSIVIHGCNQHRDQWGKHSQSKLKCSLLRLYWLCMKRPAPSVS
jgi:hypothetical protein